MRTPMQVSPHPEAAARFTRTGDATGRRLEDSRLHHARALGAPTHEFSVEGLQPQRSPAADNSDPVRAGFNLERNHQ